MVLLSLYVDSFSCNLSELYALEQTGLKLVFQDLSKYLRNCTFRTP